MGLTKNYPSRASKKTKRSKFAKHAARHLLSIKRGNTQEREANEKQQSCHIQESSKNNGLESEISPVKSHLESVEYCEDPWDPKNELQDIMAHQLYMEKEEKKPTLSGNRIVDLNYVLNWSMEIAAKHSTLCTAGRLEAVDEKIMGFSSIIIIKCSMCNRKYTRSTHKPPSTVNLKVVWGTLATGSTFKHLEELMSVADIPCIASSLFYEKQNDLNTIFMDSYLKEIEVAGKQELQLATEKGEIDKDGIPCISVYLDGGWSKRSYGHTYNAASGTAVIIGRATGKVLYVGVRNSFCIICAKAENSNNSQPKNHTCFKNWNGSASSMEADIIVEGFNASIEMHGLKYVKFIADGDSSVLAKIKKNVTYGSEVVKVECSNHAIKNYGKRLFNIKNDKTVPLSARKILTAKKIKELQSIAKNAIYENAHGDISQLIADLGNGPAHVFGFHKNCKMSPCTNIESSESIYNNFKVSGLYRYIFGAVNILIRKANTLIDKDTNNRAEIFMNILSRFNSGKRLNLIQRGSFQMRSYMAAMRYNEGHNWHTTPWKMAFNESPNKTLKKFIVNEERKKKLKNLNNQGPKPRNKIEIPKAKRNLDYGIHAEQPPLSETEINEECERILNSFEISEDQQKEIANNTIGQFHNPLYVAEKSNRLSASNFGAVCKRLSHTSCHTLVKKILQKSFLSNPAIEYGKLKEEVAIQRFSEEYCKSVKPSGLYIDTKFPFLVASPDGIINSEELVEVKCLYKVFESGLSLKDAILKFNICLEMCNNGAIRLKRNHEYYYQVQGQLHISKRSSCYFIVYIGDQYSLFVEKIDRDDSFWKDMMEDKLVKFYVHCILPEIVRGNLKKGEKCLDPQYILEAKKQKLVKKK